MNATLYTYSHGMIFDKLEPIHQKIIGLVLCLAPGVLFIIAISTRLTYLCLTSGCVWPVFRYILFVNGSFAALAGMSLIAFWFRKEIFFAWLKFAVLWTTVSIILIQYSSSQYNRFFYKWFNGAHSPQEYFRSVLPLVFILLSLNVLIWKWAALRIADLKIQMLSESPRRRRPLPKRQSKFSESLNAVAEPILQAVQFLQSLAIRHKKALAVASILAMVGVAVAYCYGLMAPPAVCTDQFQTATYQQCLGQVLASAQEAQVTAGILSFILALFIVLFVPEIRSRFLKFLKWFIVPAALVTFWGLQMEFCFMWSCTPMPYLGAAITLIVFVPSFFAISWSVFTDRWILMMLAMVLSLICATLAFKVNEKAINGAIRSIPMQVYQSVWQPVGCETNLYKREVDVCFLNSGADCSQIRSADLNAKCLDNRLHLKWEVEGKKEVRRKQELAKHAPYSLNVSYDIDGERFTFQNATCSGCSWNILGSENADFDHDGYVDTVVLIQHRSIAKNSVHLFVLFGNGETTSYRSTSNEFLFDEIPFGGGITLDPQERIMVQTRDDVLAYVVKDGILVEVPAFDKKSK